jgi:hypothetical protein
MSASHTRKVSACRTRDRVRSAAGSSRPACIRLIYRPGEKLTWEPVPLAATTASYDGSSRYEVPLAAGHTDEVLQALQDRVNVMAFEQTDKEIASAAGGAVTRVPPGIYARPPGPATTR